MAPVTLRIATVNADQSYLSRTVEEIGVETVRFSIEVRPLPPDAKALHWLVYGTENAPLDVSVSAPQGTLRELAFYVGGGLRIHKGEMTALPSPVLGSPVFDLSLWPTSATWSQSSAYVRQAGAIDAAVAGRDIIIGLRDLRDCQRVVDAGPLMFIVDGHSELLGFVVPALDEVSFALMRHAGVLSANGQRHESLQSRELPVSTIRVTTTFDFR